MKNIIFITVYIISYIGSTIFGKQANQDDILTQTEFNDILENHPKIISKVVAFSDMIATIEKKPHQVEKTKSELMTKIQKEIDRLGHLHPIKEKELLDSLILFYSDLKTNIDSEYKMAQLLRKDLTYSGSKIYNFVRALESGEKVIKESEEFISKIEFYYSKTYHVKLPDRISSLQEKITRNDAATKYYDNCLIQFFNVYSKELEIAKAIKEKKDTLVFNLTKNLADNIAIAEDSLAILGSFENDTSLVIACTHYFEYLKAQSFENHDFYGEYIHTIEKIKDEDPEHITKESIIKTQKQVIEIYNKLGHSYKKRAIYRHVVLNEVENITYKFMKKHMPKFN